MSVARQGSRYRTMIVRANQTHTTRPTAHPMSR
jgi:hypothetical protein